MKFYKIKKDKLKWQEMGQIKFKWNLPILIDDKLNVLAGNSLKNCLDNDVIVIIVEENSGLKDSLFQIENLVAIENSSGRVKEIYDVIYSYFYDYKYPEESISLLDYKETNILTQDNYKIPGGNLLIAKKDELSDFEQMFLFDEPKEEKTTKLSDFDRIEIDLEIMKELL